METPKSLASRLNEVLLNGKWIANTNYQKVLSDVDWEEANKKIADLNTIGILTFHVNYYLAGVLQVFKGGDLEIRDKFSFDAPPIESQEDWDKLKKEFYANATAIVTAIEELPVKQLEEVFILKQYGSYRRNIEGLIEHAYYHLGQVSLIKKLIQNQSS